jgi:chitin disaccharide deacetylase
MNLTEKIAKRVVLCADDFAFTASASQGIVSLIELGRLSATSAMTLSPRWANDAAQLRAWRGQVDVGLHLDWTSPLAMAAGHGQSLKSLMAAHLRRRFGLTPSGERNGAVEFQKLIHAQLDAFEAAWGAAPDHVDGHQHIQQFEGVRQALLQVLVSRYGPTDRPYLRVSRPVPGLHGFKAWVIQAMGARALLREAKEAQLPVLDWLAGVDDFEGDAAAFGQNFSQWLKKAPDGTLIMCHPGEPADLDLAFDSIANARVREWTYFKSEAFAQDLQRANVVLVRGRDLVRGVS